MVIKSLKARRDKVLVELIDLGEKKNGAILMPDTSDDKIRIGRVVSTGPGAVEFGTFVSVDSKVGDIVILPKMIGQRVEVDGKEYILIPDKEILSTAELGEE